MKNIEQYYHDHWIALDDERRHSLFSNWDTQRGEGFPIAIMALARLVNSSNLPIAQANVGIYHGGTYLLKMSLAKSWENLDSIELPPMFEGFPVIWANFKNEWVGGFRMGG